MKETAQASYERLGGCEQYRALISRYDWDVRLMMAIMEGESTTHGAKKVSCDKDAVGDNFVIAGVLAPSCGLFQVRTLSGRPPCEALKDPETNVAAAYRIYKSQGLNAWTVYSKQLYVEYLR